MHLWLGILLMAIMGLLLGLLGGGGSILAVPTLVYVLNVEAHEAIALSLIVVGTTALFAALFHHGGSRVAWKQGLLFAACGAPPSFLGAYVSRRFPGALLLLLFGLLMVVVGTILLRRREDLQPRSGKSAWRIVSAGAAVGFLTGFLGVGGGFLIVPALILFLQMPMKLAAATSSLVIAANSAVAVLGHRQSLSMAGTLLLELIPPALLGTYVGFRLCGRFSAGQLRKGFAVLVILVGVIMLVKNAQSLLSP